MLIGKLAEETGLSRDTIRFYEKKGLIPVGQKESEFNNYKAYPAETGKRLQFIRQLKGFGFTLNEVSQFLDMLDADEATCKNVSNKIDEKVDLIDQKIRELQLIREQLLKTNEQCRNEAGSLKNPDATCPVFLR